MRPSKGRIVLYVSDHMIGDPSPEWEEWTYPGVVTKVHPDGTVDVTTFDPLLKVFRVSEGGPHVRGSWFWPPRETP